tara:strand:+ start:99 stop:326 length:228 start_codon:yes stop_codon:yes gene_type:complete
MAEPVQMLPTHVPDTVEVLAHPAAKQTAMEVMVEMAAVVKLDGEMEETGVIQEVMVEMVLGVQVAGLEILVLLVL